MAADLTVGLLAGDDPAQIVRSAASVFNQSWTGRLIVSIVADPGNGEMARTVQRLESRYGRMSITSKRLHGIAGARNEVLRNTDTRFLAWIAAGQLWAPDKLDLQFRLLEAAPSRRFVLSRFPHCLEDGFTALLGETECWRRMGPLDERLTCLADEEFLLRLVLSDLSVADVVPRRQLHVSRSEVDECSWRVLAAETETVWERHKDALRSALGRGAAAQYRRRQLLRVAEAASRDSKRGIAAVYRARASVLAAPNPRAARALAFGVMRRFARAAARRCLKLGARTMTARRLGPDSRWIGSIVRLLESPVFGPCLAFAPALSDLVCLDTSGNDEPGLSTSDRRVLAVVAAAIAADERPRALDVLETHSRRAGPVLHPLVLERLTSVYLASGQADRAEDALRKRLEVGPDSGRLHRTLAELLCSKSEWQQAVEHWERGPDRLREEASVWANIGIARAYRHSGRPEEALAIARRAAERWPGNAQLIEEIGLCRPFLVDWTRCLVSVEDASGEDRDLAGSVEEMGFLNGGSEPLIGRMTSLSTETPEVSLRINGRKVASTIAAGDSIPDAAGVFAINGAALLEYLGDGDVIELTCDGSAVSMPGLGVAAMVHCGLPSRLRLLLDRLDKGYVFTKDGRLRPGHTDISKRATLDFYVQVASLLQARTGRHVFPFYGNLLGAVREGDFISHDVDGFDLLYLCDANGSEEIKREMDTVCKLLLDQGYHLKIKPWSVMIRKRHDASLFLDLNYGWFNAYDELNVSYGWRCRPTRGRDRFLRRRSCWLVDRFVLVPGNAEEVLEQLYGPGWRVPDQGFPARNCLTRDEAYLLTTVG